MKNWTVLQVAMRRRTGTSVARILAQLRGGGVGFGGAPGGFLGSMKVAIIPQ
jgi:hypothetical protein